MRKLRKSLFVLTRMLIVAFAGFFALFAFLSFLLSLPPVQRIVVINAHGLLERSLQTRVTLGEVRLGLPASARLRRIVVYDQAGQPALELGEMNLSMLSFTLLRYLQNPLQVQRLYINRLSLLEPHVYLYKKPDSTLNIDFLFRSDKPKQESRPLLLELNLNLLRIADGVFSYRNESAPDAEKSYPGRLNFNNLYINDLNTELSALIHADGGVELGVWKLAFEEMKSGFALQDMSATVVMDTLQRQDSALNCYHEWFLLDVQELVLKSGATRLNAGIRYIDHNADHPFDLRQRSEFIADLRQSKLDFATIDYFLPQALPLHGLVGLDGKFSGDWDHIVSENAIIEYGKETHLQTQLRLDQYMSGDGLRMDIKLQNSRISFPEVDVLLSTTELPETLTRIGTLAMEGAFRGAWYDFDVDATLTAVVGDINARLHLTLPHIQKHYSYAGFLKTRDLDIDQLGIMESKISDRLNFTGNIEGSGLSLDELNLRTDASIVRSNILTYSLDSLYGRLAIQEKHLFGKVDLLDGQGNANMLLDIDLSARPAKYRLEGKVDDLNLRHYGLTDDPLLFSSVLNIDIAGDSLDNLDGHIVLENTRLVRRGTENEIFDVPRVYFTSETRAANRHLSLESSLLDAELEGDFHYKEAISLVRRLLQEGGLFIQNNDSTSKAYYSEKAAKPAALTTANVSFDLSSKGQINDVFRYFDLPVYLGKAVSAKGKLRFDEIEKAELSLRMDTAAYDGTTVRGLWLKSELTKDAFSDWTLFEAQCSIAELGAGGIQFDSVGLATDLQEGKMTTTLKALQQKQKNFFHVKALSVFQDDGAVVTQLDSAATYLRIANSDWTFNPENRFIFRDSVLSVAALRIGSKGESLLAEGEISKDPASMLNLSIRNLGIGLANRLTDIGYELGGQLAMDISIEEVLGTPKISSQGRITRFSLDEYLYGDVVVESRWDREGKQILLDTRLIHQNEAEIRLDGAYRFEHKDGPLNFRLLTKGEFPLDYITPFVAGQLYGIEGTVGLENFSITGELAQPVVLGKGRINKAKIGIDYFRTEYTFSGDIEFRRRNILLKDIQLKDKFNHTADFYGNISHRGFSNFLFDLQLKRIENFLVMDTRKEHNESFYGMVFVNGGVASVTGDLKKLTVNAFAVSGANTSLKIPLSFEESVGRPDFITFAGEKRVASGGPVETGLLGFDLNLTIQATPEAEVELIFDEKVGDIIRGRGEGTLNMRINEEGEFTMFGSYEIQQGDYLFTARNVVNKKFLVKDGGRISWTGDPYEAILDLEAIYPLASVDIKPIVGGDQSLRVPVNVLMHLEGSLMQPEISLDIELSSLTETEVSGLASYLQGIRYDQQELNKQVFSLMVFNRFAPSGGAADAGEGLATTGVTSSISELLSNQLNYWLSRALGDKVSIGINTSNFQDVNLLVSARLFGERVKIERDGAIVSSNSNLSLGNISIIIKLLPPPGQQKSGAAQRSELVMEVFNRENLDFTQNSASRRDQTGIGVFYKKNFDQLREIFERQKRPQDSLRR